MLSHNFLALYINSIKFPVILDIYDIGKLFLVAIRYIFFKIFQIDGRY